MQYNFECYGVLGTICLTVNTDCNLRILAKFLDDADEHFDVVLGEDADRLRTAGQQTVQYFQRVLAEGEVKSGHEPVEAGWFREFAAVHVVASDDRS